MLFLSLSVNLYPKPNKLCVVDKNNFLFHWKKAQRRPSTNAICLRCLGSFTHQTNQQLNFSATPHCVLLSEATEATESTVETPQPLGLPPQPAALEKYLISGAFVLGIVVTVGVVFLTFAEWRDSRLKKESSAQVGKGEKPSQEQPSMNRFARRLKKKEDKLRARKKL
ncbi:hypothetical protein Gasu2_21350 [Galdieria sulphuraria]|nr:hypothetical protein Gasu2_21350 [Galdieria sulphuraria]